MKVVIDISGSKSGLILRLGQLLHIPLLFARLYSLGMADNAVEEYSFIIIDKGEVGFIDFAYDQSITSYINPIEEGPVTVSFPFFVVGNLNQYMLTRLLIHVNNVSRVMQEGPVTYKRVVHIDCDMGDQFTHPDPLNLHVLLAPHQNLDESLLNIQPKALFLWTSR